MDFSLICFDFMGILERTQEEKSTFENIKTSMAECLHVCLSVCSLVYFGVNFEVPSRC
jgi:hypothetical protein